MASEGSSSLDNSLESYDKPFISSIDKIYVDMIIEAKDKFENWFIAKVVAIDKDSEKVKVHFAGWGSRFDEWVDMDKQRLREVGPNGAERYHKKKEKPLKVGDRVQTKWEDNRSYLGHIVSIQDDSADIVFDDGVHVTRPLSTVRRRLKDKVPNKSLVESEKKEASLHALAEARRHRARKRRKDEDNTTTTDECSSPPSSPLPEKRRRRSRPLVLISEDEEDNSVMDVGPSIGISRDGTSNQVKEDTSVPLTTGEGSSGTSSKEEKSPAVSKPSLSLKNTKKGVFSSMSPPVTPCSVSIGDILPTLPVSTSPSSTSITLTTAQPTVTMATSGRLSEKLICDNVQLKLEPIQTQIKSSIKIRRDKRTQKLKVAEGSEESSKPNRPTRSKSKRNIIKSDKERPADLAPKEHVVILDHNKFKCHFTTCIKSFRKEVLLNAHLKHYHNVEDNKTTTQSTKGMPGRPPNKSRKVDLSVKKGESSGTSVLSPVVGCRTPTTKISPKQKNTTNTAISIDISNVSFNKAQSHSTPLKQSQSSSPRKGGKNKNQSKDMNQSSIVDPSELLGISPLSKLNVPPEEKGDLVYKNMKSKTDNLSDIIKVENSELYRHRGKLRPLRKSSHGSHLDSMETESEGTIGDTTEEDEEEEMDTRVKRPAAVHKPSKEGDVVHCACGDNVDEGFMIQCDQCLTWQHGECVHVDDGYAPEQYLCPTCSSPPGRRNRIIHKFKRDWFTKGTLPTLPGGPQVPPGQRKVILHTHKLADVLCKLKKMVHCMKIKLDAVQIPNHNYMKDWIRQCSHINVTEIHNYIMKVLAPVMEEIPVPDEEGGRDESVAMDTDIGDKTGMYRTSQIDAMFDIEVHKVEDSLALHDNPDMQPHPSATPTPPIIKEEPKEGVAPPVVIVSRSTVSIMDGHLNDEMQRVDDQATGNTDQQDPSSDSNGGPEPMEGLLSLTETTGTAPKDITSTAVTSTGTIDTAGINITGTDTTDTAAADTSATGRDTTGTAAGDTDATGTDTTGIAAADTDVTGTDCTGTDTTGTAIIGTDTTGTAGTGTDVNGTAGTGTDTNDTAGTDANGTDTTDMSSPIDVTASSPRVLYISAVVKDIAERVVQGDVSTQWFYKLLLLDHISHVQDKMQTCLDEVDQQIEALSPNAMEDYGKILMEIQKNTAELQQLRQQTMVNATV